MCGGVVVRLMGEATAWVARVNASSVQCCHDGASSVGICETSVLGSNSKRVVRHSNEGFIFQVKKKILLRSYLHLHLRGKNYRTCIYKLTMRVD